jgi:uncharacterized membrane protein (Fun14 family)
MSSEPLLSSIIPFAGSGLLGYAMGFALKKVLKWMLIILGFIAGMFFVGVEVLQKYAVWKNQGDIRDVISIGKLVRKTDGPEQIELIIKTMMKYGVDGE